MTDAVEIFMDLFKGRSDAYGTWTGGSVRSEVNYSSFARHLNGQELIGVYPLTSESTVRWGCSDIDVDDLDAARNLQTALKIKDVASYVEKTVKGYHVWVFADDWVPAAIMRRAFLSAHQVIGLPPKEVNPKQEEATGLGNYVRLPYPDGQDQMPEVRYMLFDAQDVPMTLAQFLASAPYNRTSINLLKPLADLYRAPRKALVEPEINAPIKQSLKFINGYIASIWRNGPMANGDRSNALVRMCHYMREFGTPIEHAYNILVDADKRWGKFHERPDAVVHLTKIIEDVYGRDMTGDQ
jgi:hypothetical protein